MDSFERELVVCIPILKRYAIRLTLSRDRADDLVQDVLLLGIRKAGQYNPAEAKLTTWLHKIMSNRWTDICRKESRIKKVLGLRVPLEDTARVTEPSQEWWVHLREIFELIDSLPFGQGAALRCHSIEGNTYPEAISELGIPEGTFKTRLRQARAKLQAHLVH